MSASRNWTFGQSLEAMQEHGRWVRSLDRELPEGADRPEPRFKDCAACPHRKDVGLVARRRTLCIPASCPLWHLPAGIESERVHRALDLHGLPTEAVAMVVDRIPEPDLRDLETVRRAMGVRL